MVDDCFGSNNCSREEFRECRVKKSCFKIFRTAYLEELHKCQGMKLLFK